MKTLIAATIFALLSTTVLAHGGGCRKDSPPGECCHMDRKKGEMHCH